ncbi:MAG: PEP-CTERM sorting domain-containing protein [Planctomycetota bacterium]
MRLQPAALTSLSLAAMMMLPLAANGGTIFDSSFRAPEFSDGQILFAGVNPDTLIGQSGFQISDSAGAGILNGGSGFQRALFGWDPTDSFDEAFVLSNTLPIEVAATDLVFTPTGTNVGVFGLSNVDGGNILGNTSNAGGVQFTWDGSTIHIDRNTNFTPNLDVDTGIASGEAFDYMLRFLPQGGGVFDIEHFVNGSLLATAAGVTPDVSKSGTEVTGFIQDFGGAGTWSVDALSLSVVPEPTAIALLLASSPLVAARRRR